MLSFLVFLMFLCFLLFSFANYQKTNLDCWGGFFVCFFANYSLWFVDWGQLYWLQEFPEAPKKHLFGSSWPIRYSKLLCPLCGEEDIVITKANYITIARSHLGKEKKKSFNSLWMLYLACKGVQEVLITDEHDYLMWFDTYTLMTLSLCVGRGNVFKDVRLTNFWVT